MITFNGNDIESLYFNEIKENAVHFNGTQVLGNDDVTPASLSIENIGLYSSKENRIETSNEKGYAILLLHTSNGKYIGEIGITSAITRDSLSPQYDFSFNPAYYLDNGTYFVAIRKNNGYQGGGHWGKELLTLNFSADTLDGIYSAKTICDWKFDHSGRERIVGEYGFTRIYFVPQEGIQELSGSVIGIAPSCIEISGMNTYVYDEYGEKVVDKAYHLSAETVYPKNSPLMVDAELTIEQKYSPIKFNVSQNTTPRLRIGYVKAGLGHQERLKWMFVQESENVKFAFLGNSVSGATQNGMNHVKILELSKIHEPVNLFYRNVKELIVFESTSSRIVVRDGNGDIIQPTLRNEGGFNVSSYKTNVGENYIYNFYLEVL